MPCYHPLKAHQSSSGGPLLFSESYSVGCRILYVPCGQCIGCRLEYARQWAVRCVHEAQMHDQNCMLLLTYDAEHLPADLSLSHRHYQLFMKRLRERVSPAKPRYFMCGEYGERYSRPHYHALLFGLDAPDRVYWKTSEAGFKCYTSKFFDSCWKLGAVNVSDMSFESASYVARYCLKKVNDGERREILDITTGECIYRNHEYGRMSRRPAVGAEWFAKYATDVFPHDRVVVRGHKSPVPKYYDYLLDRVSPLYLAHVKAKRFERADAAYERLVFENWNDRYQDLRRNHVHEEVKLAAIKLLKRE